MGAKRRRHAKNKQWDFVVKPVSHVDVATDGNQVGVEHITTLDLTLP